jgi:hypothetical protein
MSTSVSEEYIATIFKLKNKQSKKPARNSTVPNHRSENLKSYRLQTALKSDTKVMKVQLPPQLIERHTMKTYGEVKVYLTK